MSTRVKNLRNFIRHKVMVMDGAMGTMLQSHGIKPDVCPEELNLSNPSLIQKIHKLYFKAGAEILDANTFGGNRIKLKEFNLNDRVFDINYAGIINAKRASEGKVFVAGSMGPTGRLLEPIGDLSFDEAVKVFEEQARAFMEAGADAVAIETMMDIREFKAAIIGVRNVCNLPILAMMTFNEDAHTTLGTSPEVAAIVAEGLGVDMVGANCSVGPDKLLDIMKKMSRITTLPLISQANAGIPELVNEKTCYPATPEDMTRFVPDSVALGVRVIGGCCGTTPAHIKAISEAIKRLPLRLEMKRHTSYPRIASRTRTVSIGAPYPPVMIGERINPTGKEKFVQELRAGNTLYIREQAQKQTEHGADILDINISASMVDEPEMMKRAVFAVNAVCDRPIMIDSPNPSVIEAGLKSVDGKPIVNSVTAEKKKMEEIFPLVKKYGTAVIGLTLDEGGIPDSIRKRISLAEQILKEAERYGVRKEEILIDPLALAVGAGKGKPSDTIEALKKFHRMGIATILGISNVSFGMPKRAFINSSFLSMAMYAGLDAAIVNPLDEITSGIFFSSALLSGRDPDSQKYISRYSSVNKSVSIPSAATSILEQIKYAVINSNDEEIIYLVEEALKQGYTPVQISQDGMVPGLEEIGKQFGSGKIFLPQVMLSAEIVRKGFERLKQELKSKPVDVIATVLFATVEGDVHDIGKNIVIAMLENFGFEVIDLGKNVPAEKIIQVAREKNVDVIALSALMTTTMTKMRDVINRAKKEKISCAIAVGGAAVTAEYARSIGADIYAPDAVEAVNSFKRYFKKHEHN